MLELEDRSKRHRRSSHCFRKAVLIIIIMDKLRNKINAFGFLFNPDGSVYHPVFSNLDNCSFTVSESLVRDLEYATTIPQIHPCRLKFCDEKKMNDEFGLTKHLQGNGKFAAKNWKMLYCGGSRPIKDKLKDFERKFGVGLSVEKFDW